MITLIFYLFLLDAVTHSIFIYWLLHHYYVIKVFPFQVSFGCHIDKTLKLNTTCKTCINFNINDVLAMIKACKVFHNYYEVSKKLGKIVDVCLGFVQMWFLLDIVCWKRMGGLPLLLQWFILNWLEFSLFILFFKYY